jgi:hypothetical protein
VTCIQAATLQKTRDIGSSKMSNSEQFATIVRSILRIEKAVPRITPAKESVLPRPKSWKMRSRGPQI